MRTIAQVVAQAKAVKGYMHPTELRWLCETARALPSPAAWCEIGCWQGRSATAVAGCLPPGSSLLLVDNFSGPTTREMPDAAACRLRIEAEMARMRAASPTLTITLAVGASDDIAHGIRELAFEGRPVVAPLPPVSYDVVFIDGDHAYDKVVADILAWRPTLKPGGLLCGHDFTNKCGVEPAVRELLPQFHQVPATSIWYARVG